MISGWMIDVMLGSVITTSFKLKFDVVVGIGVGLEYVVAGSESAGDQFVCLLIAVCDNNHIAIPQ